MTSAPPPPLVRLSLGVTGHRSTNPAFAANRAQVEAVLEEIFTTIDGLVAAKAAALGPTAPTRLHSLMIDGVDQIASRWALQHGWELVAPLPFGKMLNLAINALPVTVKDAVALLKGHEASDPAVAARSEAISRLYGPARLFELAEHDATITRLFLDKIEEPADPKRAQAFAAYSSDRVALAARIMIEHSDLIVGVWDGAVPAPVGGTGDTIAAALELGAAVVHIDPAQPQDWRILRTPESLAAGGGSEEDRGETLARLVRAALAPVDDDELAMGTKALGSEAWHARSSRLWTGYRRVEALFGGEGRPLRSLVQTYETPDAIGTGSAEPLLAAARSLPGGDHGFAGRIEAEVLRRFAWADGISSRLADSYRGGMVGNFLLAAMAVAAGIAYQPLGREASKWLFALAEFLLLASILLIIWQGRRLRWHKRWFETRRVAEYFRHASILLLLGVARPTGRWPKGTETSWPEYYGRHGLRGPGLPTLALSGAYLREALQGLLDSHVVTQRDYHIAKAQRLTTVHHRLDRLAGGLFVLAVLSVTTYLALAGLAAAGLIPQPWPHESAKLFTYLGVMFPTLGASIAGMRYFGDFERFAAISNITAEKLDAVHARIQLLLRSPDSAVDYGSVSALAHAVDDIVVDEIENWQAVFAGKHISVPV